MDESDVTRDDLGKPIATYAPRRINTRGGKIAGLIVGIVGAGILLFGIYATLRDSRVFCVPIGGLVLAGLGVWSYVQAQRQVGRLVQVHVRGLVHTERGEESVFLWDEIAEVRQVIVREHDQRTHVEVTTHTYTIVDDEGHEAVFDDVLGDVTTLGETIQAEVSRRLLAKALRDYNRGETASFGKLSVSPEGIGNGEKTLPWAEVESVALESGRIEITAKEGQRIWEIVPAQDVPNVYVFLGLVKGVTGR